PDAVDIGEDAFNNCSSLTSLSLEKVTKIGAYAFMECSSLRNL
ncbi:hypothetical protein EOM89_00375, partial [Candidatus Falkowbacteria bacterium]|nr:hypothetical protein [Candidatus Falkowbacteria bacterium]